MTHHAVIGANFGDEGKGRTIDYLLSQAQGDPLVVRHNSGAQAGHTVVLDGKRHVNHHVGSGTLRGVPTMLGPDFVCNPILFNEEWDQLQALGVTPEVYVTGVCLVSSPLDMILNQMTEAARSDSRHGSCGVGFGETILANDALKPALSKTAWRNAREEYFLGEVARRGIVPEPNSPYYDIYVAIKTGDFDWERFDEQARLFLARVIRLSPDESTALVRGKQLFFEGAQGLGLHQDHKNFPHVTRCRTGGEDILHFMSEFHVDGDLALHYCTRPYLTRHGAGPLPGEDPTLAYPDATNAPNDWQGSLRFAPYDGLLTISEVGADLMRLRHMQAWGDRKIQHDMVVNCADQIPSKNFDPFVMHRKVGLIGWGAEAKDTEVVKS